MKILDQIKKNVENTNNVFKDNMILSQIRPHTAPVEHLQECCSGVITANYYFAARYFDIIDDKLAKGIVSELKKLQNTEENTTTFGCMRWYREEEFISDTNGAFFVLLPLALTYTLCNDKLTESEKTDILYLLENASRWFSHAANASLHYCNKIMSDGAMLALIANITGKCKDECEIFWNKWHKYCDENGWGWGENSSDCYSTIMLNALNTVVISTTGEFKEKALEKREKLLNYIVFHEGKEFIPSIRTYNFEAVANYGGGVYGILSSQDADTLATPSVSVSLALATILMYESGAKLPETDNKNVCNERLFGDSYAYTWKGENVRLGSVTHFPVMPCSYQNASLAPGGRIATYGLGWQSMPVSVMVGDYVSFLRTRTKVGENEHSHPAIDKHNGFLYNRLFEDGNITIFSTISGQENNMAIVCRYANKMANTASFICDEWCIPNKNAVIEEKELAGRKWFVVSEEKGKTALLPLDGITCESEIRVPMNTYVSENGIFKTITTEYYNDQEKLIFAPRIESAWVIVSMEPSVDVDEYLKKITVSDENLPEFEVSLAESYKGRRIVCSDGNSRAHLLIDPVNQYDF